MKKASIYSFLTLIGTFSLKVSISQWTQLNNQRLEAVEKKLPELSKQYPKVEKLPEIVSDTFSRTVILTDAKALANITSSITTNNFSKALENLDVIEKDLDKAPENTEGLEELKNKVAGLKKTLADEKASNKRNQKAIENLRKQAEDLNKSIKIANNRSLDFFRGYYTSNVKYYNLITEKNKNAFYDFINEVSVFNKNVNAIKLFDTALSKKDWQTIMPSYISFLLNEAKLLEDSAKLQLLLNDVREKSEDYSKLEVIVNNVDILGNAELTKKHENALKALENAAALYSDTSNAITQRLKAITANYNQKVDEITTLLQSYKIKAKTADDYDALVNFNKILDESGAGVPGLNLIGNYKYGAPDAAGGFARWNLFTGLTGLTNANTFFNIFVPEASTYGFNALFSLGFITGLSKAEKKTRDIGLILETNLLGKKVKLTDSLNASSFMLHSKAGVEIVLFKNVFSIRGIINNISVGSQFDKIEKAKPGISSNVWFANIGVTALMNFLKDESFNLKLDFDIIPVKTAIEKYIGSDNKLLPQIKLGLVKKL